MRRWLVFSVFHLFCLVYSSTTNLHRSSRYGQLKTNIMRDLGVEDSELTHQADFGRQYYWDDQSSSENKPDTKISTDNNELACTNYTILDTADRSADFYDPNTRKCDTDLVPGWYRFTEPAGYGGMATECPDKYNCGAYGTGWLKGSHPTVSDGVVSRRVCFHAEGECCMYSRLILVKRCRGQFYVYKLQPPGGCPFRYCGAKAPNGCKNYKSLVARDRSIFMYDPTLSRCDNTLETSWYRFQGSAGSRMSENCVPVFHCGTHSPGWLVGDHPSVLDGAVQRSVCFHWFDDVNDINKRKNNCCSFSKRISVINCDGFYVYHLSSIDECFERYCAV